MPEPSAAERVRSLETAVITLTASVKDLVVALGVVNTLSAQQQAQSVRLTATDERAVKASALSDSRFAKLKHAQQLTTAQRTGVMICVVVATVVPVSAYGVLTDRVNVRFAKQESDLAASCKLRNVANVQIPRTRELALAALYRSDKTSPNNPAIAKIHQASADALIATAVDCSKYTRKVK